ncbi:MAG: C45 family autoproteolytic acyltransferase/hydrolase, partial [Candidatus Geothermincolales bacterium]
YRFFLKSAFKLMSSRGIRAGDARARALRHARTLDDLYPAQRDRLKGLARALGLDEWELVAAGLFVSSLPGTGCTNFAAVPPATRDGRIYVSWNFDLSPLFRLLLGRIPLYIRDIPGTKPYVCMGLPVLFGIGVMNGDGLCCCVNSVGAMDGGEGLTFFELNNLAMETCSTVEEAVEVWRRNPREVVPGLAAAIIMNANSIFADASGNAVVIEHSHNFMAVERASDHGGVLASANHHQFLDRALSGGADPIKEPVIAGSFARLARMWELLEMFRGEIDLKVVRMITTDHGLNYSTLEEFGIKRDPYGERVDDATICCHPWNFFRHLRRFEFLDALVEMNIAMTLNNIVMDPLRCSIYVTPGRPCRTLPVPLWVGDALRMEWADRARGEIDYRPDRALRSAHGRSGIFRRPHQTRASEAFRSLVLGAFAALDRVLAGSLSGEG